MSKLTAASRKKLAKKDFAVPPDHYPVEDRGHAKAALSMVSAHGTPKEKTEVRAAVKRKFPSIKQKNK